MLTYAGSQKEKPFFGLFLSNRPKYLFKRPLRHLDTSPQGPIRGRRHINTPWPPGHGRNQPPFKRWTSGTSGPNVGFESTGQAQRWLADTCTEAPDTPC
jgi:hypothetical protein